MSDLELQRETVQMVPVTLTKTVAGVDTALGPTGVEVAYVRDEDRPTASDWAAPTIDGDDWGPLVTMPAPGRYRVYARFTAAPEIPVIPCTTFVVR